MLTHFYKKRGGNLSKYKYPSTGHIEINGFGEFLERNICGSRQNIKTFANRLKSKLDAQYIILTNSGSSANLAAISAVKKYLSDGDEILIAGFTFPTVVSAILLNNLVPVVVDTEKDGFNIDIESIERMITKKTRILLITHCLGFIADMRRITEIAKKHNLYLIQDCCETFDANFDGKKLSQYGDICTFSFYHPHHLSSYGGGAITVNSPELYEYIESIIHWGRACKCHYSNRCEAPKGIQHNFYYTNQGFNLEISELNAAFGNYQLQQWKKMEKRRKRNYKRYYDFFAKYSFFNIKSLEEKQCSPFVFPIIVKDEAPFKASELTSYLLKKGIEVRDFMGGSAVFQPAFAGKLKYSGIMNCLQVSPKGFFLGIHQAIPEEQILFIIKTAEDFLRKESSNQRILLYFIFMWAVYDFSGIQALYPNKNMREFLAFHGIYRELNNIVRPMLAKNRYSVSNLFLLQIIVPCFRQIVFRK